MIRYKRDVLERQSLSEVKMGRVSPICERMRKKIVEIDPFTVYVTEVRSAHVGVRTFIPSHCVNQRISRQDKT